MGIIETVFQMEGKKSPGKIKNVKKKIHARARKVLSHGIGKYMYIWVSGSVRGKICGSREKFSGGEGKAERRTRLLGTPGLVELGMVAPGSATLDLWLGNSKVRSQVIGKDRSRLPGRGTLGS